MEDNSKLKLVICPHIFEEDSLWSDNQLFDDNYMSWLDHLGHLSEITPDYDWYLKIHPTATKRDFMILDNYFSKYKKIKRIEARVSPIQMKNEGIQYAFTICGTISYEYPLIGIEVINAGINPSSSFDYAWNPKTKKEFDELVMNLKNKPVKNNVVELYESYSLMYLFCKTELYSSKNFFSTNPFVSMDKDSLKQMGKDRGHYSEGQKK